MSKSEAGQVSPIVELARRDPAAAAAQLRIVTQRNPADAGAHRMLGRLLRQLGRDEEAARAEMDAVRAAAHDPRMLAIARALLANDLPAAEAGLRERLSAQPTDVAAIRMMAELAGRLGRYGDAETLLRRALELAPSFTAAEANLATVLYRQSRYAEAAEVLEAVLARDPAHSGNRNLLAATLGRIGDYDEALAIYDELTRTFPDHAKLWMSYGHMLKTVGRQDDSIAAYRRALAAEPNLGEVWWSLANLKTVTFTDADIAAMEAALGAGIGSDDALHLHFALGKAWGDRRDAGRSFHHFAAGNALRSTDLGYRPEMTSRQVDSMIAVLTPAFLAERAGQGDPSPDPVFILGLPRAGSTLLEQILASHSAIEGTMELPDIPAMAMREAKQAGLDPRDWPLAVAGMAPGRFAQLGAEFLERTRVQRKTGRPFFIDKLPNNWAYAGFIHLILPRAKIIDARRSPMDCCFSNFRQHFAKGQGFSYSLDHIGRYYADYVRAMDHYDRVLPGRIHRVIHERLLDDPEGEVRAMLAYLGLPFEEACMEFHRNTRAVRTASSEQVRRPINRDGVDQWEPYAQWLGPLRAALGDLVETYADRPV
ncbi:tetratricopeptide repeat-containing sulfotransferase family protein [Porphyrobacter sp. AAP82]|uniref:tetratricopeptide repeat-containing sulfotransferase family protein n=1 Tax=Porphyrobacter sp. AAP82 TaxID=1248917 RepID=UPI0002D2656A|nr:tetratricopeptide repeat-containing sulfotransferase family protein [Porphyrobacter sp. AAP82]